MSGVLLTSLDSGQRDLECFLDLALKARESLLTDGEDCPQVFGH